MKYCCLIVIIIIITEKLFSLRADKHRLLRLCNIFVKENYFIFSESLSKTFHGGLKDLKKKPRFIKHTV